MKTLVQFAIERIRARRALLIFPVTSIAFILFLFIAVLKPLAHVEETAWESHASFTAQHYFIVLIAALVFFYLCNLISQLCAIGFIAGMLAHLKNQPCTIGALFRLMCARIVTVSFWIVLASTFGIVVRLLQAYSDRWPNSKMATEFFAGLPWYFSMYFLLPIMATKNKNPYRALRESATFFKNTWPHPKKTPMRIALYAFLLRVACFVPALIGVATGVKMAAMIGMVITVICLYIVSVLYSAIQNTLHSVLFLYTTDQSFLQPCIDFSLLDRYFE